jgi:hypothetical protein
MRRLIDFDAALLVLSQQFEPVRDTDKRARRKRSRRAARRLYPRHTENRADWRTPDPTLSR